MGVGAVSAALTLLLAFAGCQPTNVYAPPPPPLVKVGRPVRRPVTTYGLYTGSTKAVESVDLRARVTGFLKSVEFVESTEVKTGQLLMVIDEVPFQVKVDAAQAKVDEAQASLNKAEQSKAVEIADAQLELDRATHELDVVEERRNRNLLSRNAGSREDVDKALAATQKSAAQIKADEASLDQAKADFMTNLLAARASLESARAALRDAQIDLGYCRIYSPIDGRITRRFVDPGNPAAGSEAPVLAPVVKDDPIYAYMSPSEADVLQFREQVKKGNRIDFRKETLPIDLALLNEKGFPHSGRVDYVDPGVDPSTGTLQARGIFPNPEHIIIPGLFVRVRVPFGHKDDALLVPERAIGRDPAGPYVLVVGKGNLVEQRSVT